MDKTDVLMELSAAGMDDLCEWADKNLFVNQWQPISTAPTDGTVIDLWHKDWGRVVDQNYKEGGKFTHWMKLPDVPKE